MVYNPVLPAEPAGNSTTLPIDSLLLLSQLNPALIHTSFSSKDADWSSHILAGYMRS